MQNFTSSYITEKQEIEIIDNKKNIRYRVWKNDKQCNVTIEKDFEVDCEFDSLFSELKDYSNSITDTSIYFPNSNIESPDLMILWEIYTRLSGETKELRGALNYPKNWDIITKKIQEEIINIINK